MRNWLAISALSLILSFVAVLFWYNEWRFTLPTPVPGQYHTVTTKEHIDLTGIFNPVGNLPVFLHFFNPDCPCSKFNIPHFKSLATEYADKKSFAVILMTKKKSYTEKKIREKYSLTVPVLFETSLAGLCGVYSTPQAVLLDAFERAGPGDFLAEPVKPEEVVSMLAKWSAISKESTAGKRTDLQVG